MSTSQLALAVLELVSIAPLSREDAPQAFEDALDGVLSVDAGSSEAVDHSAVDDALDDLMTRGLIKRRSMRPDDDAYVVTERGLAALEGPPQPWDAGISATASVALAGAEITAFAEAIRQDSRVQQPEEPVVESHADGFSVGVRFAIEASSAPRAREAVSNIADVALDALTAANSRDATFFYSIEVYPRTR